MENKKLIKAIKKSAIKQFEDDLKKSIIKELYAGSSKKQIKKIRKQILREMQEELFGKLDNQKEALPSEFIHTNTVDENQLTQTSIEAPEELKEQESDSTYTPGRIFEYRGFRFDVDKMSDIVTGRKSEKNISKPGVEMTEAIQRLSASTSPIKKERDDRTDRISDIKKGVIKEDIKNMVSKELSKDIFSPTYEYNPDLNIKMGTSNLSITPELQSMNMVPFSKNFVKTDLEKITPSQKEEISFFIGKLKAGIDSLEKGEKNIFYRSKKDNVYTFAYEKTKYDKNDFSFKFNLDLNMNTYGAKINTFEFNVDGFNFDKGFVEILDIIEVLELVGFGLMKYIDEINEINDTAAEKKESIKTNLVNNVETIRANAKLAEFIFDEKILRVLQSNDINTYGQLQKIEDLTSLKGIGTKTAEKIQEYTK